MFNKIQKRNGTIEDFSIEEFISAIVRAAEAVQVSIEPYSIARDAIKILESQHPGTDTTTVEDALDAIEISLMKNDYSNVAKAFIIYRNRHNRVREQNSVFTKAIDNISLDFEIKGNASEWLWEVAHISSYCYTIYKLLPQRISHYFTENYVWIHGLPYFGRTIRNISYNVDEIFTPKYFESRGMNQPKRVSVLANHIQQLAESIHDDIGGEHTYHGFDTSIEKLIAKLPQKPTKADIQQAAEYFVYSLNNKSRTHTSGTITGPCLNIGLEEGENARTFVRYMLSTMANIQSQHKSNRVAPYIVYTLNDEVNVSPGSPNYDIFNMVLNLASKRGGINFAWRSPELSHFPSGYTAEVNTSTNLQLTLNLPKIALNSQGNFIDSLHNVVNIAAEIIDLDTKMLLSRDVDNFPTISKFNINGRSYDGTEKFTNLFNNSKISIGITGLVETVKLLNPNASFNELPTLTAELLQKIKRRIYLQDKRYKLIVSSDLKITNTLFESERQRAQLSQHGISQYSPGITLLPIGYNVKDRISLENDLYQFFDSPVPVLVQREKGKEEILEAITAIKDYNATIIVL